MGMASERAAAVTGRFVVELKAQREDKGQDQLDERLGIAQELRVGGLIMEIDGEGAVLARCFGGFCHVSSPWEWRFVRMGYGERNALKDQADCERIRTLPLNSVESGEPHIQGGVLNGLKRKEGTGGGTIRRSRRVALPIIERAQETEGDCTALLWQRLSGRHGG
jgi:hypothetical protein